MTIPDHPGLDIYMRQLDKEQKYDDAIKEWCDEHRDDYMNVDGEISDDDGDYCCDEEDFESYLITQAQKAIDDNEDSGN